MDGNKVEQEGCEATQQLHISSDGSPSDSLMDTKLAEAAAIDSDDGKRLTRDELFELGKK